MQPGFDSSIVNSITVAFIFMHGTLCFFFFCSSVGSVVRSRYSSTMFNDDDLSI